VLRRRRQKESDVELFSGQDLSRSCWYLVREFVFFVLFLEEEAVEASTTPELSGGSANTIPKVSQSVVVPLCLRSISGYARLICC